MTEPTLPWYARLRFIAPVDWIMLALALISIGLLSYETWGPVTEAERADILVADVIICLIFAVEFVWRWAAAGWKREFLWRNWYEVLGMIPVAHPAVRGFRLFRLLRIVVLLSRFGRAADRALGDDFTFRFVNRFKDAVVEAISGRVTMAVLDEVGEVLQKGRYTHNIARAFDDNREHLQRMTLEKLRADPSLRRLSRLPFYDDLVEKLVEALLRVARQFLDDPRTDELIADILSENLRQLRAAVAERETRRALPPAAAPSPPPPAGPPLP